MPRRVGETQPRQRGGGRGNSTQSVPLSKDSSGSTNGRSWLLVGFFAAAVVGLSVASVAGLSGKSVFGNGVPESPEWIPSVLQCLASCASIGARAQENLKRMAENGVASQGKSPWRLPSEVCGSMQRPCDVLHEAFCAGLQCQVNESGGLRNWWPLEGALDPPKPAPDALIRAEERYASHLKCAERCASQTYLTVRVTSPPTRSSIKVAAERLTECGLVHLSGGAWSEEVFRQFTVASARLRALPLEKQAELKRAELRANRTELFLPLEPGLPDPLVLGSVPAIVAEYIGEPFSLDYVSLLNARAGIAGTQDLHCDVAFFPRMSISVHTVLEDISAKMGPTLFCPCTHSVTGWEDMPRGANATEAVRFASTLRSAARATGSAVDRRCIGSAYVPRALPSGLVTVYDGALLHAGLENTASIDRVVLNVNFAAPPGYEEARNYTVTDPVRARAETRRWRERSNGAVLAVDRLAALREWMSNLPA